MAKLTYETLDRRVSVAPMMDWTTRHCRYFHRLLSPHALLYTEMVTTGALIHGNAKRHLRYDMAEHPVALQLGGSDPDDLRRACQIVRPYGYDEINLNCGCPSDRVQKGAFGACLMAEPELVAACAVAMREGIDDDVPVTIKTRIGIDEQDSYQFLVDFVGTIAERAKVDVFILHARKAWLQGLSPKENREIPPLDYERVARLKKDFPDLIICLNGGLKTVEACDEALNHYDLDGVMLGRAAYQTPMILRQLETHYWPDEKLLPLDDVIEKMVSYTAKILEAEPHLDARVVTRHMLGLWHGRPRARLWRQILSDPEQTKTGADVIRRAFEAVHF